MNAARREGGSSARRLLEEQGYNDTSNTAPEYIVVMAQQAVKHPAAMQHWRRIHSLADQSGEPLEKAKNTQVIEQVGGFDFLIKVDGVLYRKVGPEAAEIARMIKDPDAVEVVASG